LVESPLAGRANLTAYVLPTELIEDSRFSKVNSSCEATGRFTLATSEVRPLDRLRQLRGPETTLRELTEGGKELRDLLARLHHFFCKELELWAKTQVDGIVLGDDLSWVAASQANLAIWRDAFKPLFRQYCSILHAHDKFVFYMSDGSVGEALDDLVELGVDAVHARFPLEDLERFAPRHRRRITFWGGVETNLFDSTAHDHGLREAIFRVRKALDYGAGGVISQISWAENVPLRSIATYFEQWLIPLSVTV
jgi:uroporphyrinogen decarboxylase